MIGQSYPFKVGDFECLIVCDATMQLPLTWLPNNPAEEVKAALLAEASAVTDAFEFSINILVIRTPQGIVMVDASIELTQSLPETLKANGIDPAEVKHIIISHGDGDHIGGLAYEDDVLTYPNARYTMWKAEWEFKWEAAHRSEEPDLVALRSLSAIQGKVDLVEQETEVVSGVRVIPTPGHRIGHMSVVVHSRGEGLLHMVDAIHQPVQVARPEWTPGGEALPDISPVTRRNLVERAARENWLAMAYHFPFPGLGHIRSENGTLRWEPLTLAAGS